MSRRSRRRKERGARKAMPWWAKLLAGVAVLLVVLFFGGMIGLRWYLGSDGFRRMAEREIGKAARSEVSIDGMRWNGLAADVDAIRLKGKAGEWTVRRVETGISLDEFWDGVWVVPEVRVGSIDGGWLPGMEGPVEVKAPAAKGKSGGGLLPKKVRVERWLVDRWNGDAATASGQKWSWQNLRAEGRPEGKTQVVSLSGGSVRPPFGWLGEGKLRGGLLRMTASSQVLERSEWEIKSEGRLTLSGEKSGGDFTGRGEFEDVRLDELLPEKWWNVAKGEGSGSFNLFQEAGELRVEGHVEVRDGIVTNLPLLDRLAAYAGSPRFRKLVFDEAHSDFTWHPGGWTLRNLVLDHRGLVRVTGELAVEGDAIEGRLRVGVPPGLLAHIPGAEEKVFLPGDKGLLWAPIHVTGTWKSPAEDLSQRMILAAGERMFEMIPETGEWALRYGGQAMDQGTALILQNQGLILEEGTKAAEDVIEQGSGLIEQGVGIGSGLLNGILGGGREEDEE